MCEPAMSEAVYFNGKYCFEACFKYIKPVLAESDFAIANLKTMVSEKAPYAHEIHHIEGRYHCNAPVQYLAALKYAGFDAFALANNHNADVGIEGLLETLDHIDKCGFMRTGMFADAEEKRYLLADINGIRLAVLSYTMHISSDLDKEFFTQEGCEILLNRYEEEKVKQDVTAAKRAGAEFILCYMYFLGKEYSHEVTDSKRTIALQLANAGIDCIMGSHSHSLQHYDIISAEDGRMVPIIYSLGNFITSDNTSMITRYNVIYKLELRKKAGKVEICNESYIPCRIVEHILKSGFVVFPTQKKWHNDFSSKLLDEAQEKISSVIGSKILIESISNLAPLDKAFNGLMSNKLTLNIICKICNIEVPDEFKKIEHEKVVHITALHSWVQKGSIFFSKFTGTDEEELAQKAHEKGAKVIFSTKKLFTSDGKKLPCVIVNNPLQCFFIINRYLRCNFRGKVIAITGSVGKTTTKEMLYHVVSKEFSTVKSNENANSHAAISNMIQRLSPKTQICIQEAGAFSPGDINGSGFMLNPNACLITNVGYPHVDLYGSIENILKDKMSLVENLVDDGVAFLNYDDERIRTYKIEKEVISFAIYNKDADYTASDIIYGNGVIDFTINGRGESIPARIYMYGEYNVINALAAFAVGRWLGISARDIVNSLENYRSEGMRQNVCNIGGYYLYMDCYNSAPNSVLGSVHSLSLMKPENNGRKIVVFGDIPRLGKFSEEIHRKVGKDMSLEEVDAYFFLGTYAQYTAEELKKAGCEVYHTLKREELNSWLINYIRRDDIILFKAGHPMALAKTADQIFGTSFHITDGDVLLENSRYIEEMNFRARWIDGVVEIQKYKHNVSKVMIPDSVQDSPVGRIGKEAYQFSKIEEIVIPNSVYNIGFAAFYKCELLHKVSLGTGVKVIERSAFNGCSAINKIEIPHGAIEIGEKAFCMCKSLNSIVLPETVGHIAEDAFEGCGQIKIICKEHSYAEKYAKKKGIPVIVSL